MSLCVDKEILVRVGRKIEWILAAGIFLFSAGWAYGCPLNVAARKDPDWLSRRNPSQSVSIPSKSHSEEGQPMVSLDSGKDRLVHYADSKDFAEKVLHAQGPVLVDFYAEWCGPCRRVGSVLQELVQEMPAIQVVKVNVEASPELALQYRVQAIPSLKVFRGGRITGEHVGLANKEQLQALLREPSTQ